MISADFVRLLFGIFNFQKFNFMPKRVNSAGQKKRNNRRESAAKTLKSLTHPNVVRCCQRENSADV
jgi:hypothetical protein